MKSSQMKLLLRTSSIAVLSLFAAGCVTAPPKALTPQQIPTTFTAPAAKDADIWPKAEWWKGFGNDEMTQMIAAARESNLDIAAAAARVLQAEAQSGIADSALFPSVDFTGGVDRTGGKTGASINRFSASLGASYELDIFGRVRADVRGAEESLKASRFSQQAVALTVTANTGNAYLDVLALRQRVAIAQKNIAAARRVLDITDAKVKNGVASRLDYAQQRAQLAGQESQVPALEEQEREARYALAVLLGRIPEGFDVKGSDLANISAPAVAPGLPSELLRRRPDVAQAEAALAAAHANVDAARAAFFPSISLTAGGGAASTALSTLFKTSNITYSLGASLFQSIFEGGRLIAQSKLAQAQRQELIANYRKAVLNAFTDVESALGQVYSLAEQERYTQIQADNAAEAFRISEIQYREGVADLLSVLQSQQTLFSAQDKLVQIKLARIQSEIGLYRALGGGWQEDTEEATQPIPAAGVTPIAAPPYIVPTPKPVPETPNPEPEESAPQQ
ncbi:MAG: efflux transporter outer membrane subunit [Alphaproteobacteria bacterium]|nr:efflux transporter outer membrane subunit [Alphaproteobacteria bacterium]